MTDKFCFVLQTELENKEGDGSGPKRLHVSNIPFRFREADLRNLLGVSIY